jgi:hypothetical protein
VARCGTHKKRTGTYYVELMFLCPMGSTGHVLRSSALGAQNIDVLFFILRWARCRSHKKRAVTRYSKLLFLQPVQSVGHLVRSGVSGAWNINVLFFKL